MVWIKELQYSLSFSDKKMEGNILLTHEVAIKKVHFSLRQSLYEGSERFNTIGGCNMENIISNRLEFSFSSKP